MTVKETYLTFSSSPDREIALRIAGDIVLSKNPGEIMKLWRKRFGISQAQVAKRMGVSPSVISDYESGRRRSPGAHLIRRYVMALIRIDEERGSRVLSILKRLHAGSKMLREAVLDIKEFSRPITIKKFCSHIDAVLLTCKNMKSQPLLGYTIVDSLKLFLEVPAYDYLKLYGYTTQRAAIFTNVSRGRSPIVAIKSMQAGAGGIRPTLVVLHGITRETMDPIALKVAERERIPLAIVEKVNIEDLINKLRSIT